ncbi:uncharacterized protein DUF3549 [Vreelandella songnenensis]|uniref:Uncharacterized protein DUF3549 n=1 Tax=Vreelandella songnenensis TaxID=1176243 RepID=A0A2T0UUQ0_9GAMM|nr:DUF3549 family protein [Halomonas songnenensis]PRY61646.1 uncharacterized protein DUF3549 [Halomonas songnenensis]
MQPIQTIEDFFTRSGAEVSLYHMGRRVAPLSRETLAEFEQGQRPWPEPWQGQARLAAVFSLGDMPEPAIWFLALPLDEQGMLSPAQRDGFLNRLMETLGKNVSAMDHNAKDVDHFMKDNPLAFTPSVTFQAMLNAHATHAKGLPASQHFEPVDAYLSGQLAIDWQALGLQGIADYAVRLDAEQSDVLASRLGTLPTSVVHSLCYCLEHQSLATPLVVALRKRGEQAASEGDMETLCACIRAVGSSDASDVGTWYSSLLDDPHACGPDVLAAIAGRGWPLLEDAYRLPLFLDRLADDERTNFASVVRDIALIPRLRLPVMLALRDAPEGSAVQRRLAAMTQAVKR